MDASAKAKWAAELAVSRDTRFVEDQLRELTPDDDWFLPSFPALLRAETASTAVHVLWQTFPEDAKAVCARASGREPSSKLTRRVPPVEQMSADCESLAATVPPSWGVRFLFVRNEVSIPCGTVVAYEAEFTAEIGFICAGSLAEHVGLQAGDVLVRVNGIEARGVSSLAPAIGEMSRARRLALLIDRGGSDVPIELER